MTPADRAWELLAEGNTPQQIIAKLTPATKPEALHLARRLPLLAERPEADRGAALARIAARIGMKRHGLSFTADGRIADRPVFNALKHNPAERTLPGDGCTVTYTARLFGDRDHFQFTGLNDQLIPFTGSRHWSHFADPDAVAALGGPEAYLTALQVTGRDGWKDFERAFTGDEPGPVRKPRKPVVGEHTAKVVEPARRVEVPHEEPAKDGQPNLFTQAEEPGRDR